jgi:hypothetical protein
MFLDAGPTYALICVKAVENWPRVFTKPIREDLSKVAAGTMPFRTRSIVGPQSFGTKAHRGERPPGLGGRDFSRLGDCSLDYSGKLRVDYVFLYESMRERPQVGRQTFQKSA